MGRPATRMLARSRRTSRPIRLPWGGPLIGRPRGRSPPGLSVPGRPFPEGTATSIGYDYGDHANDVPADGGRGGRGRGRSSSDGAPDLPNERSDRLDDRFDLAPDSRPRHPRSAFSPPLLTPSPFRAHPPPGRPFLGSIAPRSFLGATKASRRSLGTRARPRLPSRGPGGHRGAPGLKDPGGLGESAGNGPGPQGSLGLADLSGKDAGLKRSSADRKRGLARYGSPDPGERGRGGPWDAAEPPAKRKGRRPETKGSPCPLRVPESPAGPTGRGP